MNINVSGELATSIFRVERLVNTYIAVCCYTEKKTLLKSRFENLGTGNEPKFYSLMVNFIFSLFLVTKFVITKICLGYAARGILI